MVLTDRYRTSIGVQMLQPLALFNREKDPYEPVNLVNEPSMRLTVKKLLNGQILPRLSGIDKSQLIIMRYDIDMINSTPERLAKMFS